MQKISKKRNYKLTRNTARISTGSVWPNYLLAGIFFISIGFACTYYYVDGGKSIKFLLKINALEQYNTKQEKELLQLKLELQMSQISYEQISKGLK